MIRIPLYVASLSPYVPGKPVEELERELGIRGSIKLASNENPLGPSPKAISALTSAVLGNLNRYPDGGGYYLRQALSKKLGVPDDHIMLGNGSNELLDIAAKTFMEPGDEAVMAWPSFVVYPMATQAQNCKAIKVPCKDLCHDLSAMADAITDKTRMIFIANPNNPTGTMNTAAEFDAFMATVPEDIIVVVDEAYYEYVSDPAYPDSMKHLKAGSNLLILRTFSKAYGLAGLRIGYGLSKPEILSEMNKIREPFNTSSAAQAAALAALDDTEHIRKTMEVNAKGKSYLFKELASMGLKPAPTEANFIFIPMPGVDTSKLNSALLRRGIIIRPMGPEAIRVTIGLQAENEAFVRAFGEALKEAGAR